MIWYAARNAILPSVSGFSLAIGFVVSGSLLTEIVFSYPGIGYILLQAVTSEDYPLLQGIFLIITFAVLAANLIADSDLRLPRSPHPAGGLTMMPDLPERKSGRKNRRRLPSCPQVARQDQRSRSLRRHHRLALLVRPSSPRSARGSPRTTRERACPRRRACRSRRPAPLARHHAGPAGRAVAAARWRRASTILVAFIAGVVATVLVHRCRRDGAGYYGGLLDDLLSMLANVFLRDARACRC